MLCRFGRCLPMFPDHPQGAPRVPGSRLRRRSETQQKDQPQDVEHLGHASDPDERPQVLQPLSIREQTRSWLAKVLTVCSAIAVLVATGIGMWTGEWRYVNAVWAAAGAI